MAKPFIRVVKATRHAPHDAPGGAAVKRDRGADSTKSLPSDLLNLEHSTVKPGRRNKRC
jgi:hypothetical protein